MAFGINATGDELQKRLKKFQAQQKANDPVEQEKLAQANAKQEQADLQKNREQQLAEQFAGARTTLAARRAETGRRLEDQVSRFGAVTGRKGGTLQKIRQQGLSDIGRGFATEEANLGAQEAGAKLALSGEEAQRAFASEESRAARAQQQRQFELQLSELGRQFDLEFDENQKTNFINAIVALKEGGLRSMDDFANVIGGLRFLGGKPGASLGQVLPTLNPGGGLRFR